MRSTSAFPGRILGQREPSMGTSAEKRYFTQRNKVVSVFFLPLSPFRLYICAVSKVLWVGPVLGVAASKRDYHSRLPTEQY